MEATTPQATSSNHPRTSAALARLRKAMSDVELDIAENKGVYPYNFGRVTQSELCRRADVKKATLQNPLHKDTTRVEIMGWLDALNSTLTQSRVSTREKVTAIADDLTAEVERLKLDLDDARRQLAAAQQVIRNNLPENTPSKQSMPELAQAQVVLGERHFTPGTTLRHYKGGLYRVVGACTIEATLMPGVLYQPLQGDMQDRLWMRPLSEFADQIQTAQGVVPRFVQVSQCDQASS